MSDSVAGVLAQLDAAIDALAEVAPRELERHEFGEVVVEVQRRLSRLDAQTTRLVGVFDTHGDPQGAAGSPAWLAWRCRLRKSEAKAMVSRSRALRSMPAVEEAFAAGGITREHVSVLGRAQRFAPEAFAKAEDELVGDAVRVPFEGFRRAVRYFEQLAEPDLAEQRAQDAFERRQAFASKTFEDTVEVDARFDPVGGAIFKNELDRLERQLFEADWAEARSRLGEAATKDDLWRTPAQRRLDAMTEMAKRSAAMPADAKQARYLLTVLVGYETFAGPICQLADGTVVTPGQVVPLLTDADIERVVFDGPSRVVDVGRRQRVYTGGTRRAVEVRDLECTHDACDVAYERCDVDHALPWVDGGETTRANGRLRCPRHNPGRRRPQP